MSPLANRSAAPPDAGDEEARARIASLEREARALGNDPTSALLFHEIGLLWEDPLKNPRNAAVAYQNAYKLAPAFLANIRAARRLFSEVGNWQMVIQLIDAEIAASEDPRPIAGLLLEKALVLEQRLSREDEAKAALAACLARPPEDLTVLVQLEQVFAEQGDAASLVQVCQLQAERLQDESLRAHYLTTAGLLLEDRLQNADEAATCYLAAFALDRKNPLLIAAYKRVARRIGADESLLSALAAEAEEGGSLAGPAYLEISKTYARLGRTEDALAALLAARRVNAADALVLAELARVYEAQGRYEELADVLLAWSTAINDEGELVALNLRLASLYEETLKRDDAAINRYQAILARVPGQAAALAGLGKLYFRSANWEGLLQVYDDEIAATDDPKQKAARMFRAAEVLEVRLGQEEDAIYRYNQCLQLHPGYLPAQKALSRLYERQSRFAELVAMYEQELLQTTDRDQSIATLNTMALLYEDRLSDLDRAIDCMRRILEIAPDHLPTIRNLGRLYERSGMYRELIQVHETEAALAGDTKQVLSLHHHNAEILEEQLQDLPGAIAAYEQVLSLSPSYLPALRALGRLYAQQGQWDALIRMYRTEAEISPADDQAAALICKVGELYEQKLQDPAKAISAYQEVLNLAPGYFTATSALARLYRASGEWEHLIEVLRAEASNRTDPLERANVVYQAATIWEDALDRKDQAIEGYREALRLSPSHPASLRALERLFAVADDNRELLLVLERQAQVGAVPERVAAYLKQARIYLDRLEEPTRAAQCCEALLALEPTHVGALKLLERLRAGDRTRRADLKLRLAEAITEPRLKGALRVVAAIDRERPSADAQLQDLQTALAASPDNAALAFSLERALRQADDVPGLIAFYEQRRERAQGVMERVELTLRVADVCERHGDLGRARTAYAQALELSPGLLPALQGAQRVALRLNDHATAVEMLAAVGRVARDPALATSSLVQAGRLAMEQLNDPERALAAFRQALERDPLHLEATSALEELLARRGGAADLAGLQERRAEAKLAQQNPAEAAEELYLAARTYLDKLNDPERARAAVEKALSHQPAHAGALEAKGELALVTGSYAEAAAALAARVQQGGDAAHLAALHLKLGAIYHDHLSEPTRAAAHLQTALTTDPRSAEALGRLASIHLAARNWTGAADSLKRLLELELSTAERAQHTATLAGLYQDGFSDPAQAATLYRKVLELSPADPVAVERLGALYEQVGNLPELVKLLEQQAAAAKDVRRAVTLQLKVGELYARPLDQPDAAIRVYRQAIALDPRCLPARTSLAEVLSREGDVAAAVQEHLALLKVEPTHAESLRALVRLWRGQGATDRAFCAAALLVFLQTAERAEVAFFEEKTEELPLDSQQRLLPSDVQALLHPGARNGLVEVVKAIGDQLGKQFPPQLEALGVDRKADRLKPDSALAQPFRGIAHNLGLEDYELFQARRGAVQIEIQEPLAICLGPDLTQNLSPREARFVLGRAALAALLKAPVLSRAKGPELADLIGSSVRIFQPAFTRLGQRQEELTKQLKKTYSRKALKALESASSDLAGSAVVDIEGTAQAVSASLDRAGLLLSGDVVTALHWMLREGGEAADPNEHLHQVVLHHDELRELFEFALSDVFFDLRKKVGLALT